MLPPSYDEQKAIFAYSTFVKYVDGRQSIGEILGYDHDHRGFGAVILFGDGSREFWMVNPRTRLAEFRGNAQEPLYRSCEAIAPHREQE